MKTFREFASTRAETETDSFIYGIIPRQSNAADQTKFSIIASDDTCTNLSLSSHGFTTDSTTPKIHSGVTCLHPWKDDTFLTAGRDGLVRLHDGVKLLAEWSTPNGKPISALAASPETGMFAAGTEHVDEGIGEVAVYIWQIGSEDRSPLRSFVDSHTDTITSLLFHPSSPSNLLSASTDGLVTVFDVTYADEEDAVLSVLNNRSAVNHIALAGDRVCTMSADEQLTFLAVAEGEPDAGPWDVKHETNSDYVVCARANPQGVLLIVGAYKPETTPVPRIDILLVHPPLKDGTGLHMEVLAQLTGAHGVEVVRDIWLSNNLEYVVTCGEDGMVRGWKEALENVAGEVDSSKKKTRRKSKSGNLKVGERFRPY